MEERKCAVCGEATLTEKATCSGVCARELQNRSLPPKLCAFPDCNVIFAPKSPRAKYCAPKHEVLCACGNTHPTLSANRAPFECSSCAKKRSSHERAQKIKSKTEEEKAAIRAKTEATNLERYGVRRPLQGEAAKAKAVETNRERYGADYALQTEEVQAKRQATNLKRYGVAHPAQSAEVQEKARSTNQERYGADHFMRSPEGLAKHQDAMREKHGVANPMELEEVREKVKATNKKRYGGASPFSSEEVQGRARLTMVERYGEDNYAKTEAFLERMKELNQERYGSDFYLGSDSHQKALRDWSLDFYGVSHHLAAEPIRKKIKDTVKARYGVDHVMHVPEFLDKVRAAREELVRNGNGQSGLISKLNRTFAHDLEERFGVEVTYEKALPGASFDLAIEGTNLLIDLNPTVTHNTAVPFGCLLKACKSGCKDHRRIENNYHFSRARIAQKAGYRLIQVYDWDDRESVLDLIAGRIETGWTRHSARKLTSKKITQAEANKFLALYHFQGSTRNQINCYGLFKDNELIAVATFGKSRFNAKEEFEWIRYAVKKGHIVHGGPNKLWTSFLDDANPTSVISYVDYNHSTSSNIFLTAFGFDETEPTGPNLTWYSIKKKKRIPQTSLLRLGADRLLGTTYGSREESGLNNEDIMLLEGFLPVYTAGNRVFRWAFTPTSTAQ